MDKKWWIALSVALAFVAALSIGFGLWQMGEKSAADARAFTVAVNFNTMKSMYLELKLEFKEMKIKYETCMDAHKFGGRKFD